MLVQNSGTPCSPEKRVSLLERKEFLHSTSSYQNTHLVSPQSKVRGTTYPLDSIVPEYSNITSSKENVRLKRAMNPHFAVASIPCFFTRGSLLDDCKVLPRTCTDVSPCPAYLHQLDRCKRGLGCQGLLFSRFTFTCSKSQSANGSDHLSCPFRQRLQHAQGI